MTWSRETSNGFESRKIRFDVLPYLTRGGLDIGCGPAKVWPHLIGIDNQKDTALFGVEMRPDLTVADAARLALIADDAAENVFSSHTLEHLPDWHAALREWWRVLKAGGHLVLYLPDADLYPRIGQPGANPDHRHDFKAADILDFIRLAFPDWSLLRNEERAERDEYSFLLVLRKEARGSGQREALPERPAKAAGLVRLGGNGDALWAAGLAAELAADGYAVTAYVGRAGEEVLRHDPAFARIVELPQGILGDDDLLEFWAHEAPKYDKWVNLIGSVEGRLLPHQSHAEFYLPHAVRHRLMNGNYADMIRTYAQQPGGPLEWHFKPTEAERRFAKSLRDQLPGPVVVLSPTGSGPFKAWPHAQEFMQRMADAGVYTVMFGDLKALPNLVPVERHGEEFGHVVGMEWPLRLALAYAQLADAVVATESVIANAVAWEPMPKVVMLSHSSHENLTRDWPGTTVLEAGGIACHPCHRIHNVGGALCARDLNTGGSACMASYGAEHVAGLVLAALGRDLKAAA